jgi:hypothetical protein
MADASRRVPTSVNGYAAAVLVIAAAAFFAACGTDQPHRTTLQARGAGIPVPPRLALLRRPRAGRDSWPPNTNDRPLVLDRSEGRRLGTGVSRRLGLWLAPSRGVAEPADLVTTPETPRVCLRVIPLSGPDRGGGGSSCVPTRQFVRQPRILVILTAGSRGVPGFAPHQVIIAGVVPDGVRDVRLGLRDGGDLVQRVQSNAFVFETVRIVNRLSYRTREGLVRQRLVTCQMCPLGASSGPAPPPVPDLRP